MKFKQLRSKKKGQNTNIFLKINYAMLSIEATFSPLLKPPLIVIPGEQKGSIDTQKF